MRSKTLRNKSKTPNNAQPWSAAIKLAGIAAPILCIVLVNAVASANNYGTRSDVSAIRATEIRAFRSQGVRGPILVREVRVCGGIALVSWEIGESGGQSVFRYERATAWKRIANGGGALNRNFLIAAGSSKSCAAIMIPHPWTSR